MFTLIKYPLILLIFLAGIIPMASAQTMYRYTKNGDSIISSNLPPDVVNEGYEILSPRGNIIETVPPRKSKQQIKQQQAQEQLAAQAQKKQALIEQQQAEQRKKDQLLLKMFNSKEGIKRVHKNKIEAIENIEKISQDNLKKLNKKLSKAQQREAQLSDSNRAIPAKLQE